ncbi:MAG: hypothetical protein HY257_04135, partial [Chloroflexi bacterium]|nr:hypothetical protein [Chloroflexota bacterium]
MRNKVLHSFFDRALRFEIGILSAIYVVFVLTDQIPFIAFLLIAFFYFARQIVTGKFTSDALRNSFLTVPILFILALLPISLAVSVNWFLSLPKVYGIILGALFFFAIVNQIQTRDDLARASVWLVAVCLGIAVAGLIGTDWAQGKIVGATFLYDHLPRFIQSIPRSIAGGFARNGVGGTLAFTIPFLAAMGFARGGAVWARQSLAPDSDKNRVGTNQPRFPNTLMMRLPRPYVSFVIFSFIISLVTLALTQS